VVIKIIQYAKWSIERISALARENKRKEKSKTLWICIILGDHWVKISGRLGALNCLSGYNVKELTIGMAYATKQH
jgi:hypothetical protein